MKTPKPIEFKTIDPYGDLLLPDSIKINSLQDLAINQLQKNLINQLDNACIEGLKRKGFEFEHPYELEMFVKERCRCEDNIHSKEKVYFVDETPFLLHKYNVEFNLDTITENGVTSISASLGEFCYL